LSSGARSIAWRNWRLRYGFNPREGLVLHQVGYDDNGRVRPILYRAAVSRCSPPMATGRRSGLVCRSSDEGVLGLGYLSAAVELGKQVPANAATLNVLAGDASSRASAINSMTASMSTSGDGAISSSAAGGRNVMCGRPSG